ncbi:MAG: HD domain-containing protein [Candidatus Paceibacterota bacterium]
MVSAKDIIAKMHEPTDADRALVEKAYNLSNQAHEGITRYSGEPFMSHVATVALYLAEMGMGPRTITAGLLHDIIEDTEVDEDKIREEFGEEILFLVDGVTKLSSVRYYGADRHNESLRKLFIATSQDIRVLIIKLVDRLHNMQTLEYVPKEKQQRIARETLEVYVPVAHRLGMGRIRKELEDLAFPYVYPEEYKRVKSLLTSKTQKSEEVLERERRSVQKRLGEAGLRDFVTAYRVKGLYSLFQKLKRKDWDIERIFDLMAMRIVVDSMEQCYQVLGIVHDMWRPLPKRVKDYIAFPKPNGYQSIHTTVTTDHGTILEIQIRTKRMHHEAEYGVAPHMIYKNKTEGKKATEESDGKFANLIPSLFRPFAWRDRQTSSPSTKRDRSHHERIPDWIREIGEMYTTEKSTSQEFADDMQRDFFTSRIFVFTPNGDVVDLPAGASPIDFAYTIHSEVGNHVSGAKVNNKLVSLDTELRNGDIVEIETKKTATPSHKWLEFAKTSIAKRRIRTALAEEA